MPDSSSIETHSLLNSNEFKDMAFEAGYDRSMGARLFNTLASNANLLLTPVRNADSIAYFEKNREGQVEPVVSVPNLRSNLHQLESVPQIGAIAISAVTYIINSTKEP